MKMKSKDSSAKSKVAQASKPERLFIFNDVVKHVGITQAAIISDLYFWFSRQTHPWRTYQNWADWLCVDKRTVARQVKTIDKKVDAINRERTRYSGGLGAYKFSPTKHENSKYLLSLYERLLNNQYSDNDIGSLDQDFVKKPKFQMVYVDSIKTLGGLMPAYIINSLAWYAANLGSDTVSYQSMSALATRLNIDRVTLIRNVELMERKGFLFKTMEGKRLSFELMNEAYEVQNDFFNWLEVVREKRIESFNQCF